MNKDEKVEKDEGRMKEIVEGYERWMRRDFHIKTKFVMIKVQEK